MTINLSILRVNSHEWMKMCIEAYEILSFFRVTNDKNRQSGLTACVMCSFGEIEWIFDFCFRYRNANQNKTGWSRERNALRFYTRFDLLISFNFNGLFLVVFCFRILMCILIVFCFMVFIPFYFMIVHTFGHIKTRSRNVWL